MERNTKQKQLVMEALKNLCHPSAQEIYEFVKQRHPHISMGTIYRILSIFEEQQKALRIEIPNKPDCYDYNTYSHYHLSCKMCKKVYDMPIPYLSKLNQKTDEYIIEDHIILFNGLCANCLKNTEGK